MGGSGREGPDCDRHYFADPQILEAIGKVKLKSVSAPVAVAAICQFLHSDDHLDSGRDLEKVVLWRAVRWHLENRILVYKN
jgi:hypothetical protein